MNKEVILTGLRSNSEFHLGNYLGAIQPMVELQKRHAGQYQLNMFIPDLHSFTTPVDHHKLYHQSIENLKVFVAAGLDIDQPDTFIYRQSFIPAHSELTWILSCFTGVGELSRMTQFKEKKKEIAYGTMVAGSINPPGASGAEVMRQASEAHDNAVEGRITGALFNYPVLMAADILLYGAKWIPVGDDQRQHVEFTRDLAMRMNNKFGDIFVVPEDNAKQTEFSGRTEPVRIRSLRNPDKKMSKSVDDPAGTIMLTDNPDDAAQKIMSARTDSLIRLPDSPEERREQPGVSNLMLIKALLTGNMNLPMGDSRGYDFLKQQVAKDVKAFLADFQKKLAAVDKAALMKKLETDEAAMNDQANAVLLKAQEAVGLRPKSAKTS